MARTWLVVLGIIPPAAAPIKEKSFHALSVEVCDKRFIDANVSRHVARDIEPRVTI